jgi:hypothetical protein
MAMVAAITYFALRHRQPASAQSQGEMQMIPTQDARVQELQAIQIRHELYGGAYPQHELYGEIHPQHELYGGIYPQHELSSGEDSAVI